MSARTAPAVMRWKARACNTQGAAALFRPAGAEQHCRAACSKQKKSSVPQRELSFFFMAQQAAGAVRLLAYVLTLISCPA